jgi:phosphatidylglycerophosphate synthase
VLAVIVLAYSGHLSTKTYFVTITALVVAMITDALDGRLARRWRVVSASGYVIDAMGDRAIHLAMILVYFVRYGIHPVLIWLLIFRDIAIYGIRVLSADWLSKSRTLRWNSLFHATSIRVWIGIFLVRDGVWVATGSDRLNTVAFQVGQLTILVATIIVSYYGLYRSFGWLLDHDHETL